jgi:outer membrane protein assembly factor BamB
MNLKITSSNKFLKAIYFLVFHGGFESFYLRKFLLFLGVILFSGFNPALSQNNDCWNNFRGDARLSGVSNAVIPDKPELLWTFKAPDGFKSSPVVCKNTIVIGSIDGNVYGLTLQGKLLWKINTENSIESPALIVDEVAYIGNLNGDLFAIELLTGKILWTYKTDNQIMGSPNYFTNGISRVIIVGSYDYCLHGVDLKTGKGLWKYEADNFINGTPSVYKGLAIFGGCDGLLHQVNAATGILKKRIEVATYVAGSVAVEEGNAYVGDYDGKFSCLDVNNMSVLWSFQNETVKQPFIASPSISETKVFIGNRDKYLYSFDKKTGNLLWKINTGGGIDASPVIVGKRLLVANMRGDLILVNASDGKISWSFEIGNPVIGNPAVINNHIIVGASDGRVYCFGKK